MYSIAQMSGQLGLIIVIYRRGTARISQLFRCFLRDSCGPKVRNSAPLVKPAGCSFAAFNSEISERGSKRRSATTETLDPARVYRDPTGGGAALARTAAGWPTVLSQNSVGEPKVFKARAVVDAVDHCCQTLEVWL